MKDSAERAKGDPPPLETMEGPGHAPQIPHPSPKIAEPASSLRSILLFSGKDGPNVWREAREGGGVLVSARRGGVFTRER